MSFRRDRMVAGRVARGMTQEDLAEKTGIAQPHLSDYESGSVVPSVGTIVKIARALNYTTDHLLDLTERAESGYFLDADELAVVEAFRVKRREAQLAAINEQLGKVKESYRRLVERAIVFLEKKGKLDDLDNNI